MMDLADSAIRKTNSNQGLLLGRHGELLTDAADPMLSLHTNVAALSSKAGAPATSTERSLETLAAQATNTGLNIRAAAWATAEWARESPICESREQFEEALRIIFDPTAPGRKAARGLSNIKQVNPKRKEHRRTPHREDRNSSEITFTREEVPYKRTLARSLCKADLNPGSHRSTSQLVVMSS
ncbi:hypothetical protein NHX12_027449 [Muraenolepis orangiensis]|uniref:Uncharacterized protein n=1 Tax=Muraenolepis orangiensis TaxID=630683 RepID=A0A9Q0EJ09_9TELE|nr:hypothetical protein NHX12_027449 [Muraenolepis orangiensis]